MKKIAIYLAGSIKKGHEKTDESFWTTEDMDFLKQRLKGCAISFLNPAFRLDDLSDQRSVFGRDMVQVSCCDIVFVDARDRRGLGVGAEMMWAKVNKIPVMTWAPKDTHYRKSHTTILGVPVKNFIHPFVEGLSDKIVENLEEASDWIQKVILGQVPAIKGIECMSSAMQYYKEHQLHRDEPMQALMALSEELKSRIEKTHSTKP